MLIGDDFDLVRVDGMLLMLDGDDIADPFQTIYLLNIMIINSLKFWISSSPFFVTW